MDITIKKQLNDTKFIDMKQDERLMFVTDCVEAVTNEQDFNKW